MHNRRHIGAQRLCLGQLLQEARVRARRDCGFARHGSPVRGGTSRCLVKLKQTVYDRAPRFGLPLGHQGARNYDNFVCLPQTRGWCEHLQCRRPVDMTSRTLANSSPGLRRSPPEPDLGPLGLSKQHILKTCSEVQGPQPSHLAEALALRGKVLKICCLKARRA